MDEVTEKALEQIESVGLGIREAAALRYELEALIERSRNGCISADAVEALLSEVPEPPKVMQS